MDDEPAALGDSRVRFLPGELLAGRFRIVREVAQGGMGIVYEAIDEKLERRIAIKTAKPGMGRRLLPEVLNASMVSHPNVCKIFEIHSASTPAGDVDFITMEFLDGDTLAQRLARGRLPDAEGRRIALQICAGIAEAHRNGIVHGDLKPTSIKLPPAPGGSVRAVIMDFGLTHGPRNRAESGGTPGCMAPELLAGGPVSVASDIYALGFLLHELVTGLRPEEHAVAVASTVAVTPGAPASASAGSTAAVRGEARSLGSRWDPILRRCLAADPAERFADVAAVERALDPPRRHGPPLAVAAVLVALAAGIAWWRVTTPPETVKLEVDSALPVSAALKQIKGTSKRAFALTRRHADASHLLRVRSEPRDGRQVVQVQLLDARSHASLATWEGAYEADELAFAPAGVAGVVSAALHLKPPPEDTTFRNAQARADYEAALPLLRNDDRLEEAFALMQRSTVAEPASALPLAGAAEAAWRKCVGTDSLVWLERCKESVRRAELRGQDSAPVHRIAGLLLADDARLPQAIIRYQRATELPSGNADSWRRLGDAYQRINQLPEALAALRRAVDVEPGFYRTHQDLGGYFFNRGNYSAAVPEFRIAIALEPGDARLRSAISSSLTDLGDFAGAEHELRAGLALQETPEAQHSLGQVLMYESRETDAIPCFRRALALKENRFLSWLYLGNCLLRTNRPGEAREAHERGLALVEKQVIDQPQNGRYHAFLAYLFARVGQVERARTEIDVALRLTPDGADALRMAVLTYEAIGKRDDALRVLRSAPPELLADLSRWPEAAALNQDERFQSDLLARQKKP